VVRLPPESENGDVQCKSMSILIFTLSNPFAVYNFSQGRKPPKNKCLRSQRNQLQRAQRAINSRNERDGCFRMKKFSCVTVCSLSIKLINIDFWLWRSNPLSPGLVNEIEIPCM